MKSIRPIINIALLCLAVACAEEEPPRSVDELENSPFLLEAALVRCAQDRTNTKYDPECINAREAVSRLETRAREARHEDLEAQSVRKRRALRRTQEAAAEVRRRIAEADRQRQEAEYLGLFETVPDEETGATATTAVIDAIANEAAAEAVLPGNQPGAVLSPPDSQSEVEAGEQPEPVPDSIESIREELKERQNSSN